jgi:hypothetical protein
MFGGSPGLFWPPFFEINLSLAGNSRMTAIAVTYTSGQFLMAADGRGLSNVNPSDKSDKVPKIFPITDTDWTFGYALTGCIISENKSYNLVTASRAAIDSLAGKRFDTSLEYLLRVTQSLTETVSAAKRSEPIPEGSGPIFARMIFAGFFKAEPTMMLIEFQCDDAQPRVSAGSPPPDQFCWLAGPPQFTPLFLNGDTRFREYLKPLNAQSSADEAEAFARGYIDACSDRAAVEIDPECKKVGGHFHAAEITPDGFRWRISPTGSF